MEGERGKGRTVDFPRLDLEADGLIWLGSDLCTSGRSKKDQSRSYVEGKGAGKKKRQSKRTNKYCHALSGCSCFCSNALMNRCRGLTVSLI